MDPAPLHPNLARVAAIYDQVTSEWAAGRIGLDDARRRLAELIARDDQGARWRIDPDTGNWCRWSLDGTWVEADPPTWGLATPDGWDLSGGIDPFADPRRHIESRDVDVTRVTDTSSLTGATLRASAPAAPERPLPRGTAIGGSESARRARWMIAAAVLAVALLGAVHSCGPDATDSAPSEGGVDVADTNAAVTAPTVVGRSDLPG